MLKQKFTQNDILSMKIQSGEEIICKFISQTDSEYLIERPLALVMMQKGLGFAPWLQTSDVKAQMAVSKDKILTVVPTVKEAKDQYITATTGIAPAGKPSIVTV